ncbi:hypothetical protein PILCRDRAFT_15129, partial [Piloderma croceum F 1598]
MNPLASHCLPYCPSALPPVRPPPLNLDPPSTTSLSPQRSPNATSRHLILTRKPKKDGERKEDDFGGGVSDSDGDDARSDPRADGLWNDPPPTTTTNHVNNRVHLIPSSTSSSSTSRRFSNQLESAVGLSSSLQAQHATAQSTISALESK